MTATDRCTFEQEFTTKRPWLYHLTAARNVVRIRRVGRLQCAATLLEAGGHSEFVRRRRRIELEVRVGTDIVHVRDQQPLHSSNMELCDGWSFEDWVAHLNGFVFFWPGYPRGPIPSGLRHFFAASSVSTWSAARAAHGGVLGGSGAR